MPVTHTFVSAIPDGGDTDLVRPSDWNADHDLTGLTASDVGAESAGAVATHAAASDPHTGYVQESLFAAKGDILTATANDTPAILTVGTNDQILMADSAQTAGLKWASPATPSAVSTANAEGTADSFARGDHVHAHESAHINHDTTWAAKGDLIAATANDAASVLTVGTNDQILMAASGQATGLIWASPGTPSTVSTSNAEGTTDGYARTDHVHAHESAHINHDTTWAAQGDLIVGTANDTAAVLTKGSTGQFLQAGSSTVAYVDVFTPVTFSKTSTLTTGTGTLRWYNDTGRTLTISEVRAAVGTAPTGQSILCDVNIDGTTIWSTQANRVAIAAAANTGSTTTFDTTTIADNSYFTVDVDQIGSGTAGSDLTVTIILKG